VGGGGGARGASRTCALRGVHGAGCGTQTWAAGAAGQFCSCDGDIPLEEGKEPERPGTLAGAGGLAFLCLASEGRYRWDVRVREPKGVQVPGFDAQGWSHGPGSSSLTCTPSAHRLHTACIPSARRLQAACTPPAHRPHAARTPPARRVAGLHHPHL